MNALETLLQDILAKAEAATPGPWTYDSYNSELKNSEGRLLHWSVALGEIFDKKAGPHVARLDPPTAIALVKICRRAVEAIEYAESTMSNCYLTEGQIKKSNIVVLMEALAEINELAKGI